MSASVDVVSFGCRLNLVEGEAIRRAAISAGRDNLIVVNSCGVTGEAARQARQAIRRLKRDRPEAAIVVTGCAAEMEPERFRDMPEITDVIDNHAKTKREAWQGGSMPLQGRSPLEEGVEDHTRAFLAIQNGCDHDCTFCAIPLGRGTSRSAPVPDVVASAQRMVERGFREIVLTGVDLTSYGSDLPHQPPLGRLVRTILRDVPELERLRLSSIDCIEADPDLLAAFAEEERLMPYLHLSLQSGDDLILKRMKRRHARKDAVDLCAELRRRRPDVVFGADLIAGFPTETEEMAAASRTLIDDCGLTFLHVFPFSPRPSTPAARMPQVAPGLAKERAKRLREMGDRALRGHLRNQIGRTLPVLVERGGQGRAPDFTPVATGTLTPGSIADLSIAGHNGRQLVPQPSLLPLAGEGAEAKSRRMRAFAADGNPPHPSPAHAGATFSREREKKNAEPLHAL